MDFIYQTQGGALNMAPPDPKPTPPPPPPPPPAPPEIPE